MSTCTHRLTTHRETAIDPLAPAQSKRLTEISHPRYSGDFHSMGNLSCLGCHGHNNKAQTWSPLGNPSSALKAVRQNYKICPRCKRSCPNAGTCTHCGKLMNWPSLPSLPCLSLFNPKNKRTQAGHQVASPPEGRWSKYRAKIAFGPKKSEGETAGNHEIRNIIRSCGHCNQPVNYADICNRFCPECGWPLSLTSSSLDKYADVVRAGPHQQGRRRIRSMILNRSSRARHWELSCIEERSSEEGPLSEVQVSPASKLYARKSLTICTARAAGSVPRDRSSVHAHRP